MTYQIGVAPGRIDILTAWDTRIHRPFGEISVDFIGRAKDLGDIEGLE